jgi:hypothetical protein
MPKGFISNFNIQHVTSCFVAGHFVAITSFYRSSGGIANPKNYKMFYGSNSKLLQNDLFFVIMRYPNKSSYKMVSRPHHINPHTALKNYFATTWWPWVHF